jgi:hypothetical protein
MIEQIVSYLEVVDEIPHTEGLHKFQHLILNNPCKDEEPWWSPCKILRCILC